MWLIKITDSDSSGFRSGLAKVRLVHDGELKVGWLLACHMGQLHLSRRFLGMIK